ncbi:ATP-binding protein [bacterium]|nr:ATP-binding protein [bacterium]
MIISVASGKGGTGKTLVSTSLALSMENNVQLLDCDVEEPNAHIFIKAEIKNKYPAFIPIPQIDKEKCNFCGKCAEVCVYNAIAVLKQDVLVFKELCHGCGACSFLCPQKAIREINKEIGVVNKGNFKAIEFIEGKLNIGEAMAPPLIRQVKEHINAEKTVIIDAPPGTSCPVIVSITETDFCLLVTEPTPFGLNDLILSVEVMRKLKIPFGVIINRCDLGDEETQKYCTKENIPILMNIPFKKEIAIAYSKGTPLVEAFPEYKNKFMDLLNKIKVIKRSEWEKSIISQ